jgi:RNA polymerase sigma-70 factor (ECF subfamily)
MLNVFINQLRSQPAGLTVGLDDEALPMAVRPTQSDRLEVRDLQASLLQLPDEQREVLLLVGLEQMTYEEAAGVLGIPIGTVMSRLSRAREKLRALLANGGGVPAGLKVVK